MEKLIEKVKQIEELNKLIGAVTHMCSNRDDNLVILALKKQKTNIFKEAQEIADILLNPVNKIENYQDLKSEGEYGEESIVLPNKNKKAK